MISRKFTSRNLPVFAWILAIILRCLYWVEVSDKAWFISPGTDPAFYLTWANDIINGNADKYIPFPRGPLYPYLLSILIQIFGDHWLIPRFFNLLCEIGTIWFIYSIGYKIGGLKTAHLAAIFYSITGISIYYSGEILMTSLSIFLLSGFIYFLLLFTNDNKHLLNLYLSSVMLSLAALNRPNALVLFLIPILILTVSKRKISVKCKNLIALLIPAIIVIAPVTSINYLQSQRLIPISYQGGVNFYIGNHHDADGWSSTLPGVGGNWEEEDARLIASKHNGREVDKVEASGELWKMGFDEILNHPLDWSRLMIKKLALLFNMREVGNNRPLSIPLYDSVVLRLFFYFSVGLFFPFAICGMIYQYRNRVVLVLIAFLVLYSVSILLFFINSRYRFPVLPVLTVMSSYFILHINKIRESERSMLKYGLILLSCFIFVLPNWFKDRFEQPSQTNFYAGNAELRLENYDQAIKRFQIALSHSPGYPELNLNLGVCFLSQGKYSKAEVYLKEELKHNPRSFKALNNLGVISEKRNNLQAAERYYRDAYEIRTTDYDAKINLWRVLMKQGDMFLQSRNFEKAEAFYKDALSVVEKNARTWYKLALVSAAKENVHLAIEQCRKALFYDKNYLPAVELHSKLNNYLKHN